MATVRRTQDREIQSAPAKGLLGRLRETQLVDTRPVLPAEILSAVLDHLAVPELICMALASKRMREMVYDDTRWVQRLRLMGCWNEAAARARAEHLQRRKTEDLDMIHHVEREVQRSEKNVSASGVSGAPGGLANAKLLRNPSIVVSTGSARGTMAERPDEVGMLSRNEDGFDETTLSPQSPDVTSSPSTDGTAVLDIMSKVRSIRGLARQEYGKIYSILTPFFRDAIRTKHPSNAKVFRTFRNPNQQAQMLAQLLRFAKSDFSQGQVSRERKLLGMIAAFEDAVSREFEQGLKIQDVDGRIKKYANVLVTLNGGQRAIDRFIGENPLFKRDGVLGDPMDCISPSNRELLFLEESHAFFGRLSVAFNAQLDVIDRGFPASADVATPLLQKTSSDVIFPYLDRLFACLQDRNQESYVRAIAGTYEQSLAFANSLQGSATRQKGLREAADIVIADLFAPHIGHFLDEELAWFKRRSDTELSGWERQLSQQDASIESLYMANVNRQADKRDFLTSFKKVLMMPVNVLPAFPNLIGQRPASSKAFNGEMLEAAPGTSTTSSRSEAPSTVDGVSQAPSRVSTPFSEPPTTELAAKAAIMKTRLEGIKTLFSLEVALNLVQMARASIERIAIFAKVKGKVGDEARSQCETIFVLLLQVLGSRHIRAGFDQAVEHLSRYNPRAVVDRESQPGVAPLVIFLELVNVGDLIQQMLDVFFEQELVATRLTDRSDFLNPTVKEKKRFEQMLDERVAAGLNKGIEVLMAEVEYICATTQRVEDFNPGAAGVPLDELVDVSPTDTAVLVVEVVSAHTKMLLGSTDKNMLDVFNQEVGLRLFTALCKHLKRQRVSVAGSIRLISDMNHHFQFIMTLKNKDLLQYFRVLRELSHIYLISASDAKELATIIADKDRFLGILPPEEVYEFAERRADWYQVKSKVEKHMYGFGCSVM